MDEQQVIAIAGDPDRKRNEVLDGSFNIQEWDYRRENMVVRFNASGHVTAVYYRHID
jgi:hypothetical protein